MFLDAPKFRSRISGLVVALSLCLLLPTLHAQAPTENLWTGAVSSQWDEPGNWSLGHVPYSIETARIDGGSVSAGSIGCVALMLNSGTLTLNGDLNALSATIAQNAFLIVESDVTHRFSGTVNNSGFIRWENGNIEGPADSASFGTILNTGVLEIRCDRSIGPNLNFGNQGAIYKSAGGTPGTTISAMLSSRGLILHHSGTLVIEHPVSYSGDTQVDNAAVFWSRAMDSATITPNARFWGDGDIRFEGNHSGVLNGKSRLVMSIGGDLTIASGSTVTIGNLGDSGSVNISGTLTNHGTVLWQGNSIEGGSGGSGTGHIINAPDGIFDIQCDNYISANITFDNQGSLLKSVGTPPTGFPPSGSCYISGPFTSTGSIAINTGSLSIWKPIAFAGNVDVSATASFTAFAGMASAIIESTARFEGAGDTFLDGDFSGTFTGKARFNYRIGGALTITSGSTVTIGNPGGTGSFNITGTLTNHGTILWQGNSIEGGSGGSGTGHIINAPDGIFDIQCDNYISANITFDNQGSLLKSVGTPPTGFPPSGSCYISGPFTSTGSIAINTGSLSIWKPIAFAGNVDVSATASFTAFAGMASAIIESTARFEGAGDTFLDGDFSGTFTGKARFNYRIGGALTITSGSTVTIGNPGGTGSFNITGTLTNHGTILWQGNSIGAGADGSGTGHIINAPDGIFDIQCDNSISSNIAFDNQGLFLKPNGPGATSLDCVLSNSGTAEIRSGTLLVFRGINQTAGITRLAGGSLYCTAPSSICISGGELSGAGSIVGPVRIDGGTLRPGDATSAQLTIYGDLTITGAGTVAFRADGAAPGRFSTLRVNGNLGINGALAFDLGSGFIPINGDAFHLVTTTALTGEFASTRFPTTPTNATYTTVYGSGTIDIVTQVASYSTWRKEHFGNETDPAIIGDNADPDRDGVANLLEYAFGLEPLTASRSGLPITTLQSAVPGGPLYLTLSFKTPATVTDLSFVPQVSGNLVDWLSGPGRTEIVSDTTTAGLRTVVVRDTVPVSAAARRFIQLQVRKP